MGPFDPDCDFELMVGKATIDLAILELRDKKQVNIEDIMALIQV